MARSKKPTKRQQMIELADLCLGISPTDAHEYTDEDLQSALEMLANVTDIEREYFKMKLVGAV